MSQQAAQTRHASNPKRILPELLQADETVVVVDDATTLSPLSEAAPSLPNSKGSLTTEILLICNLRSTALSLFQRPSGRQHEENRA